LGIFEDLCAPAQAALNRRIGLLLNCG
jgi:hypothetical protein